MQLYEGSEVLREIEITEIKPGSFLACLEFSGLSLLSGLQ